MNGFKDVLHVVLDPFNGKKEHCITVIAPFKESIQATTLETEYSVSSFSFLLNDNAATLKMDTE